jgi:hypothetical protein
VELRETTGSAKNRLGARFRKVGAWEGARFSEHGRERGSRLEHSSGVRTGGGRRFGNQASDHTMPFSEGIVWSETLSHTPRTLVAAQCTPTPQ